MLYYVFIGIVLVYSVYRWLVRPLNRVRHFGDVGFYFGDPEMKGRYRAMQLERARRLRSIGDIPPVYPNGWFCIAESHEIKPKQVKAIVAFGEQLTLIRSEAGKVYLIDSYCPHLGANFSVGGRVVNDNCVQCPFHGWIFSGETGKCTSIPYTTQSIPEQAKVSIWPVVERNRHIYVWYNCDGKEPDWDVPEIEGVESGEWSYKGRTEHEIMCHIQDLPENGADIAHLNYLHLAGVLRGNDITKIEMEVKEPIIRHIWDGKWEPQPEPNQHIAIMYLNQVMTFMKTEIPLTRSNLQAKQIGPGIVQMMFDFGWLGRGVVLHHVTPEEPMFQRARFVMYATLPKVFAKFFLISEANHFERDIYIWNNKRYVRPPMLVRNDGPIGKHRRWYNQFYSENSPKLNKDGTLSNQPKSVFDW
ncbi:unnamed protein product [Anisakis simplex]|uniref:cholesterol 7-desaturase n=1 Tax=Anisakis simplex TaxID=6269 RepID=A0A0M3JTH2_ANISI|nr:unnamed protein product [Anisakis simplex]